MSTRATLKFKNRSQAEQFAISWTRYSKTGHMIGSGTTNVEVTVYNITDNDKNWIEEYISNINS